MIYRVCTLNLKRPTVSAAHALMLRVAAYVNENFPGVTVEVLRNVGGSLEQLYLVTCCASLTELEEYEAERQLDRVWLALLEEWRGLEAEAMIATDQLYRSLL